MPGRVTVRVTGCVAETVRLELAHPATLKKFVAHVEAGEAAPTYRRD
jgi:hypothetical protein